MAVIINYAVDKDIYYAPQANHNITMITTEYICGANILVHLEQSRNLNIRLKNILDYTEQEILEEYVYTDKTGNNSKVQIIIKVKSEAITAVIDFKDAAQCENFVCPAWLAEL